MTRYTVGFGNAFEGVALYGLWEDQLDAIRWAEIVAHSTGDDWHIVVVHDTAILGGVGGDL